VAKKDHKKKAKILTPVSAELSEVIPSSISLNKSIAAIVLFAFGLLLYANTLKHQYAQDDAIVIYDNMYTTQGIAGIGGLLKYDTFFGFFKEEGKAALVSGGRYRPLTPIMFAVEWQLFDRNPMVGHLINILLYGLLGILIFYALDSLLINYQDHLLIAFGASLVFIAHPIHTEVVANIKGRDEIVSMIASVAALYLVLKKVDLGKNSYSIMGAAILFLGLLSKENAITFLAIIPFSLYFFRGKSILKSISLSLPLVAAAVLFIAIRTMVLGFDFGGTPSELMNNPYIKIEGAQYVPFDLGEKFATIFFTLGKYMQLLFFPHPLTHDYYPRHIEMMQFSDPAVLISVFMYLILIGFAILGWKKKQLLSYSILFYLSSLSIVSNIVFPIGTNMSERFLFMPSLGFAIAVAYGGYLVYLRYGRRIVILGLLCIPIMAMATKTVLRNNAWYDDFSLFITDIEVSKNSAKLNNAVGGALSNRYHNEKDINLKRSKLNEAIIRLNKAIEIHPNYKNPYLIRANCYHFLGDFKSAEQSYIMAINLDPGFNDAIINQAINYREMGKQYGAERGDLVSAIKYLKTSFDMNANDYETVRLLGIAHGNANNYQEAISYFAKALQLSPNSANAHVNLAKAYSNAGEEEMSQEYANKARNIDPNVFEN